MTETMIDLPGVIAKSDDADFLPELIQDAALRLMDIEVGAVCGAGPHERTPDRENQRNGYRPRRWDTRAGTIGLNIPKLRKGSHFPTFLELRRTAEKALMAVIQGEEETENVRWTFSRRTTSTASPPERWTTWCAPWG